MMFACALVLSANQENA